MIDRTSPIPMYLQVKQELEELIRNGSLKPGDRISSESELCKQYGVSRITAKKTLDEMVKDGCLYRIQGRGSFVQGPKIDHKLSNFYSFTEEVKARGMVASSIILLFETVKPKEDVKEKLGITNDEMVYYLQRIRKADDTLIALDHSYIPCTVCQGLSREDMEAHSLYEMLNSRGVMPDKAIESFSAASLNREQARLLGEKAGTAVLKVCRQTYCNGRVVEYNYRYYKGDQYSYTVELNVK